MLLLDREECIIVADPRSDRVCVSCRPHRDSVQGVRTSGILLGRYGEPDTDPSVELLDYSHVSGMMHA